MKQITVKPGDSLWSLAKEHLGNPYLWPKLYEINERVITRSQRFKARRDRNMRGPDWIFDGTVLNIPDRVR